MATPTADDVILELLELLDDLSPYVQVFTYTNGDRVTLVSYDGGSVLVPHQAGERVICGEKGRRRFKVDVKTARRVAKAVREEIR